MISRSSLVRMVPRLCLRLLRHHLLRRRLRHPHCHRDLHQGRHRRDQEQHHRQDRLQEHHLLFCALRAGRRVDRRGLRAGQLPRALRQLRYRHLHQRQRRLELSVWRDHHRHQPERPGAYVRLYLRLERDYQLCLRGWKVYEGRECSNAM
jgi:hypothetical protein